MFCIVITVFRLTDMHSSVCVDDLQSQVMRLKIEADDNRKRDQDIIIEKRKAMIQRANETVQRHPESKRQLCGVSKAISIFFLLISSVFSPQKWYKSTRSCKISKS